MKKILILCFFLFNMLILCFSQSNNYANGNGTIIETKTDGNVRWIYRKHIQYIQIGDLANDENLIIYNKPALKNGAITGKLKINDDIHITGVMEAIEANHYYYWLNINMDNGINGWIFCGDDEYDGARYRIPYFDNRWEIIESINSGGKLWTIRKMIGQLVSVWEVLNIRDKPGLTDSKIISKIVPTGDPQINLNVIEATEEKETIDGRTDRWLKINYNGVEGWIFGGYTSIERGGPQYWTPETIIYWKLGSY
jgi:hypothetical protein